MCIDVGIEATACAHSADTIRCYATLVMSVWSKEGTLTQLL